ncbi:L,D-transpeptidase family protein [Halomonas beimenensis]|uniref:ErfK/YbiS/YcfS/YnhG family protein n=1 Tax=Halomonas beimenensis TaxID=475662 RepID=A0A291P8W9_9GAMM|nr:L,D-transpeptidase family protein [Halomonas beimenensis]ATJ83334.1 ErfK/YbiS/YcfS/YnhG family protein [Halomonas beimenensis]
MTIDTDGSGRTGVIQALHWLQVAVVLLAVGNAPLQAAGAPDDWPKGHYPLPERGDLIGEDYTVEAGAEETLLDLAREHNLGYKEIRRANPDLSVWMPGEGTEVVIPAQRLLPPVPREGIVINLAELRLYYYPEVEEGEAPRVETHPIGIGREGFDTPLGKTETTMRIENPAWYPPESVRQEAAARGEQAPAVVPPGPDNPLGDYAILLGFDGYLIHGTNRPDGIGMRASRGCIRMFPEDIESIFARVPVGTQVNIIDQPIKAGWHEGTPYVQAYQPLEVQENGMAHLLDTLTLLGQPVGGESMALDYQQLRGVLDAADGQAVAIRPAPEPQPVVAEAKSETGGIYEHLGGDQALYEAPEV